MWCQIEDAGVDETDILGEQVLPAVLSPFVGFTEMATVSHAFSSSFSFFFLFFKI